MPTQENPTKVKHEVSPEVLNKVKQWTEAGKKVYRGVCSNFGCLAEIYSSHDLSKRETLCPSCRSMGGGFFHDVEEITPEMLRAIEVVLKDITPDDLSFEITDPPGWASALCGPTLANIDMSIKGHWRPIKLPVMIAATNEREYRQVLKSLDKRVKSSDYLREHWEGIQSVCERVGYNLLKKCKCGGEYKPGGGGRPSRMKCDSCGDHYDI